MSTLNNLQAIDEVTEIVKCSVAHNAHRGITGALLFTGSHFAQALEGEAYVIDELMGSIRQDSRHRSVIEVHRDDLPDKRFDNWAMAYGGPATYVDRPIEKLILSRSAGSRARAIERVYDLMTGFTK